MASTMRSTLPRQGGLHRAAIAVAASLLATGLGGCASVGEASGNMSQSLGSLPVVGLPANAPERPAEKLAFPAVHAMPAPRTTGLLTADEQRALERDLVQARDTQRVGAGLPPAKKAAQPAPAPAAKPAPAAASGPRVVPASSSQMIY
jgi:hypothetical protein